MSEKRFLFKIKIRVFKVKVVKSDHLNAALKKKILSDSHFSILPASKKTWTGVKPSEIAS